jgi:hypothetical protein
MLALKPAECFSWAESKHPISELLIQHVYLDSNYVFCGSDASWGTNAFGLFVFDRRLGTWTNYPGFIYSNSRYGQVKAIEADGDSVYVTFHGVGTLALNRHDGSHRQTATRKGSPHREFILRVGGASYRISRDSVIVTEETGTTVYVPSPQMIPQPAGPQPMTRALQPIFGHPVLFQNEIYMPYDLGLAEITTHTDGIGVFDVSQKKFRFYGSDTFKGTVTGGFVHESLIVFPTAKYWYEGNATPAAGFVAFSPSDLTFSAWKELPLPEEPLAIFQIAQDDKEYWVGTDKGIFRIDKSTNRVRHYQITRGTISKDGALVYPSCGDLGANFSPVVARLDKGRDVDIVALWNGWCEVESPKNIGGFVEGKYVEGVTFRDKARENVARFHPLQPGEKIPVRSSAEPGAELMLELDANSLKENEYKVVATVTGKDRPTGYMIKLPTVWISMDDLLFQLGEVD